MSVQSHKQKDPRAKGTGHPVMFGMPEAEMYDPFPEGGGYPTRFLSRAFAEMKVTDPTQVLHVCSGSVRVGITVDRRISLRPRIVADAIQLPFRDDTFQWILADPPYSREYAANLYGTELHYPSPHVLVNECLRVLKPGGYLGFMHHMVPKFKKPGCLIRVYGISQGVGYNIRAWTLLTKVKEVQ